MLYRHETHEVILAQVRGREVFVMADIKLLVE